MENNLSDVLIVVDMQNDFITGPLGTENTRHIVPNVVKRVSEYFDNNKKIIFKKDTHDYNYFYTHEGKMLPTIHGIPGTWGYNIHSDLEELIKSNLNRTDNGHPFIVEKGTFAYTDWVDTIDFVCYDLPNSFEICGLCTDVCVMSNALILRSLYPEAEITVNSNLCAGTTRQNHDAAIKVMKSCLINVI